MPGVKTEINIIKKLKKDGSIDEDSLVKILNSLARDELVLHPVDCIFGIMTKVTSSFAESVQKLSNEKVENWTRKLSSVYNRGFWDGYYLGRELGEWSEKYGSQASRKKIYVGKINNYFTKIGVAEILVEATPLNKGEDYIIIGPTTGVVEGRIDELRVDNKEVEKAAQGETCSIPVNEFLRRADKIYKLVENS